MPQEDAISHQTHGERALWTAVVLQSIHDLDHERHSTEYTDAVAFFTGTGEWRRSRTDIADRIGVHADDLERCGRRLIDARRIAGVLPVQVAPLPSLVVAAVPIVVPEPVKSPRRVKPTKDRNWWISRFLATQAA